MMSSNSHITDDTNLAHQLFLSLTYALLSKKHQRLIREGYHVVTEPSIVLGSKPI